MGAKVTALENDAASIPIIRSQSSRYGFTLVEGAIDRAPAGLGPFDVIIINGVVEIEPESLFGALADNGRLVTIFGKGPASFIRVSRRSGSEIGHSRITNASGPTLREFASKAEFVF
jgi:protein-L-isoaspartate(D-aspartate) O-methyltransferase